MLASGELSPLVCFFLSHFSSFSGYRYQFLLECEGSVPANCSEYHRAICGSFFVVRCSVDPSLRGCGMEKGAAITT